MALENGTEASFSVPIHLDFKPDEVILRQLNFGTDDVPVGTMLQLYSNLIPSDEILGIFSDATGSYSPATVFQIGNFKLSQTINFQVQLMANARISSGSSPNVVDETDGELGIVLEFVKYKN